jgi:hypothetical protein
MRENIVVNLPQKIRLALDEITSEEGVSIDDLVCEAVTEYLFFRRLRLLRERMIAKAQLKGIYKDQDVFDQVS